MQREPTILSGGTFPGGAVNPFFFINACQVPMGERRKSVGPGERTKSNWMMVEDAKFKNWGRKER